MNKLAQNSTIHPQTVEVPAPLEIHPSVDPVLAQKLLRITDMFSLHPETFNGFVSHVENGCGCIIAHLKEGRNIHGFKVADEYPASSQALRRIYNEAASAGECAPWAINRIETFLRTGE